MSGVIPGGCPGRVWGRRRGAAAHAACAAAVEPLEGRTLFSFPAAALNAYVGGSAWTASFKQSLVSADVDYGVDAEAPYGPSGILPWVNLNQVSVTFVVPVEADRDDLIVRGVTVPEYGVVGYELKFNPRTYLYAAVWTLDRPLANDRVNVRMNVDGPGGVTFNGGRIDGNGDGAPGGDRTFNLKVLPGDAEGNTRTSPGDIFLVRSAMFRSTADPGRGTNRYGVWKDLDGSGRIDSRDLLYACRLQGNRMPPEQSPAAVAGGVFGTSAVITPSVRQQVLGAGAD